jgi:hypothetical protein
MRVNWNLMATQPSSRRKDGHDQPDPNQLQDRQDRGDNLGDTHDSCHPSSAVVLAQGRGQVGALNPHPEKLGHTKAHQDDHPNERYATVDSRFTNMAVVLALNFH